MEIHGVGVAGATKILGLSNQKEFCIYDSRVGYALSDLNVGDEKLIKCPQGRGGEHGDIATDEEWALNYQRLIWTLQIMREYLVGGAADIRISDLEMALFMKGKRHKRVP